MDLDGRGVEEGLGRIERGRGNHNPHIACKNVFLIKGKNCSLSSLCIYSSINYNIFCSQVTYN